MIGPPIVTPPSMSDVPRVLTVPVRRLDLLPVALQPSAAEYANAAAVQFVGSALGDDVDDAAGRLAELGFVAARFDLDFLHEVVRRRRCQATRT